MLYISRIILFFFTFNVLSIPFLNQQALAGYNPDENNPLLGKSIVMDPITCSNKYGTPFCECWDMEDGTQGCKYREASPGPYKSLAECERVWGAGYCQCTGNNNTTCSKKGGDESSPLTCGGEIQIFPGEKFECRTSGIMTGFKNCCKTDTGSACNFENTADTLGYDKAIMKTASMAIGFAMKSVSKEVIGYASEKMIEYALSQAVLGNTAASSFITSFVSSSAGNMSSEVATATMGRAIDLYASVGSFSTTFGPSQVMVEAMMETIGSIVSFVGWIYTAYQLYQIYQTLTQCTVGEDILACKVGTGRCHFVGTKCKLKVFSCLQKAKVYCCFGTKLARIIHEQGREQLGAKGPQWGDAKSPQCRGFTIAEFAMLDFGRIDLSEYFNDIVRQTELQTGTIQKDLEEQMKDIMPGSEVENK